jgi:hypothetical protein
MHTQDQKIWIRSSVFAERLWNSAVDIKMDLMKVTRRLAAQGKRMKMRGLKVSPVTVQLC